MHRNQNPEATTFIEQISALPLNPSLSLDAVLERSVLVEGRIRSLFATDRANDRLYDPYVGLVDVFHGPRIIRTTRARKVENNANLSAHHVMPLGQPNRRKDGDPSTVAAVGDFQRNWALFTEGMGMLELNWSNVIAAGGSVLSCLSPLPNRMEPSEAAIKHHYRSQAYATSDIDLFLWGLSPEEAEAKIIAIYAGIRRSAPSDVDMVCVRNKHTVSIYSQYPRRVIQIVLRLYQSPAEVLAGFDIDASCCAYDGDRVWASPRAVIALMRQCNTVDMTRRSPSYEFRLAKYSRRGFEVYVPSLRRSDIDLRIYGRSVSSVAGLARLLILESFENPFLTIRLAAAAAAAAAAGPSTDAKHEISFSYYDITSLRIPYGPGWDAESVRKLMRSAVSCAHRFFRSDSVLKSTAHRKGAGHESYVLSQQKTVT
ncbi:hypothetical protein HWV62_5684 [Athelia sp. TMB]|nr:hypothetical protein HWV62_5684 [Athelia sp. TMB]